MSKKKGPKDSSKNSGRERGKKEPPETVEASNQQDAHSQPWPADGNMVDLDAFLLELSQRLVTVGSIPLPRGEPAPVEPVERTQVVVFSLQGTHYAVDMRHVSEVVRDPGITPVPGLPGWVLGVTNLHGEIMSVIDLALFLEAASAQTRQPANMIVARAADQQIGLMVDDVALIYTFPLDQMLSPPFKVEPGIVPYLRGAVERDEEFIRILDCESLLLGQQMQQFS